MARKRKQTGADKLSNKIDISQIDLEKEKDKITDLPGLIEYAHHAGSAIIKPEDKGRIKGTAIAAMHDQTDRQFRQLFEQMQTLIEQAKYLKARVDVSETDLQGVCTFSTCNREGVLPVPQERWN